MEDCTIQQALLDQGVNEPRMLHVQGFGEIKYGVNLVDTVPRMESRKSIRKYHGAYIKTNPLLTWSLFLCLILLWGFSSVDVDKKMLVMRFAWEFEDAFFGLPMGFDCITAAMWVLSILLMFYYVRYQVTYQLKSAIYITQLAIFLMFGAIGLQWANHKGIHESVMQPLVQGAYLLVMTVCVAIRMYQINFLPVWQEKNMFLAVPLLKPLPEEVVIPQLLSEYSGRVLSQLHWCAYECVGKATRFLPRPWAGHFKVMYVGEVDDELRPHGFGEWWDIHYHGEHLVGLWQAGKPIGPFKSREKGSSSGFKNIRISYFMNRADPLDKQLCCPTYAPEGELKYGLLSVECSVSGTFFRDYPRISYLDGPHVWQPDNPFHEMYNSFKNKGHHLRSYPSLIDPDDDAGSSPIEANNSIGATHRAESKSSESHGSWVVQRMERSPSLRRNAGTEIREDTVVISAQPNCGLVVSGYEKISTESKTIPSSIGIKLRSSSQSLDNSNEWTTTALDVVGWEPKMNHNKFEALVFIHGFNAAVSGASRIFGQFLALSNLPPYIKPIIFSWPGGSEFAYFQARMNGVESPETLGAFLELMRFLALDGFTRVHIMTHSMGARVLTGCAVDLEKLLQGVGETRPDALPLRIVSITLLSPDVDLEPFREDWGHQFRSLCPLVTIYGDRTDWALNVAEVANWGIDFFLKGGRKLWRKGMKRGNGSIFAVSPKEDVEECDPDQRETQSSVACRNRGLSSKLEQVLTEAFPKETRFAFSVFGKSSQKFKFMRGEASKLFRGFTTDLRRRNLGKVTDEVTDAVTGEPLDIDVIDTSFMDANVHALRHNYFNLNRELVEDIRELLVTQRRAHQRASRLEWLGGNVFAFVVAPTFVVNPT